MSWFQVQKKTGYGIKKDSRVITAFAGVFREGQCIHRTGGRPVCLETGEQR